MRAEAALGGGREPKATPAQFRAQFRVRRKQLGNTPLPQGLGGDTTLGSRLSPQLLYTRSQVLSVLSPAHRGIGPYSLLNAWSGSAQASRPGASTGRFPPLRTRTPDLAQVPLVAGVALVPRTRAVYTVEAVLSPPTPW